MMNSDQNTFRAGDVRGLLRVGGLDLVQAGLDHRGERVQFLASQMWMSAVLGGYCSGETGQPEGEGEGVMALVEVPEGGQGLRR